MERGLGQLLVLEDKLNLAVVAVLQETQGSFQCPICMDDLSVEHCFLISQCNHRWAA